MLRLFLILSLCMAGPCSAQTLYSKDGVDLGSRQDFMNGCLEGVREKLLELQGVKIAGQRYCQCMADAFFAQVTAKELEQAIAQGGLEQLMLKEPYLGIVMACVQDNASVGEDVVVGGLVAEGLAEDAFLRECERAAMNALDSTDQAMRSAVGSYCRCALDRIRAHGTTYGALMQVENENSVAFNELVMPCVALLNDSSWTRSDSSMVVEGPVEMSEVALVDMLGRGYRLQLMLNGLERSFLFDTGASDLLINAELATELRNNGSLSNEHRLGSTSYELADGSRVKAEKVRIDTIIIGEYQVRNVVAGVVEGGSLLCGRSLLDRFSKWEIDGKRKVLVLHR